MKKRVEVSKGKHMKAKKMTIQVCHVCCFLGLSQHYKIAFIMASFRL